MPAIETPVKKKWNNIGVPPLTDQKLKRVCRYRGWTKTGAVLRMTERELEVIQREQHAQSGASNNG